MRTRISLLAATAALTCTAAVAPTAGADTFCAPAPCADGTPKATIEEAVQAADARSGSDVVSIKAGTFTISPGPYGTGLSVGAADTEIHGAGRDATVLTTEPLPSSAGYGRTILSGYMRRLADLTLRLPSAVTPGHNASITGADVYDGVVERVRVDAPGATFGPGNNDGEAQGMLVRRGTLRDVAIDLPRDADTFGLRLGHINGDVTIDGAEVTARSAVHSSPQTDGGQPIATVSAARMRIRGGERALAVSDGRFELRDATVELASGDGAAASVYSGRSPSPASLVLDRVTLLGPGTPGSAALANGGHDPATATTLRARHVLAAGFGATLLLERGGGRLVSAIDHSALPETVREDGTDGPVETSFAAIRGGDPLLTGPGEPTVRAGSPAVDVGGEPLLGPLPATDLAGAPRVHDGDGDGTALVDAGAFEYQGGPPVTDPPVQPGAPGSQPPAPLAPGPRTDPGAPAARDTLAPQLGTLRVSVRRVRTAVRRKPRALTVAYTLGEPATVTVQVQRRKGRRWVTVRALTRVQRAGRQTVTAVAKPATLRAGTHRLVVTATDAAGNRTAPRTATFTVTRR